MPNTVEITPSVLTWAISEEGISDSDLADRVGISLLELRDWKSGQRQPTRGQFSRLVTALHRPRALFYLPTPPRSAAVPAQLRSAPGLLDHVLVPTERRLIRQVRRMQHEARWLLEDQETAKVGLPLLRMEQPAAEAGATLRDWLGVKIEEQFSWDTAYAALREWRRALDENGVVVMQLQLGRSGVRGFSLFDDYVPVLAVNTAYNVQARIFTIFHELAHLALRRDSLCAGFYAPDGGTSPRVERWCEEAASAALIPRSALLSVARERIGDRPALTFEDARKVADRFKVSLRAAALRLIREDLAPRELYGIIERRAELVDRPRPGGGGGGRPTARKRVDELGRRLPALFLEAARAGAIPTRDALQLVGISTSQIGEVGALVGGPGR